MSRGTIARATIVGRMGASLHVRKVGDKERRKGELSLAVNHGYGDRQGTSWFSVIIWNDRLIDIVADYAEKGSLLFVEGELSIRKYQKDGQDRYVTEITVGYDGAIEILKGVQTDEDRAGDQPRGTAGNHGAQGQRPRPIADDDLDDDVPF